MNDATAQAVVGAPSRCRAVGRRRTSSSFDRGPSHWRILVAGTGKKIAECVSWPERNGVLTVAPAQVDTSSAGELFGES